MAVPPVRDIRVYNVNVLIHQTKITKESTDSNDKKNLAEKRHLGPSTTLILITNVNEQIITSIIIYKFEQSD